jgi:hypothetical protein
VPALPSSVLEPLWVQVSALLPTRRGPTPTCSADREPWPRTRPHPDRAPAGPTGREYGRTAMRLRPGRARLLVGWSVSGYQAKGGEAS